MFPALVRDDRRKGRSAGPLVEASIALPKIKNANAKQSLRLQDKAQEKADDEEILDSVRLEGMALAVEAVLSEKSTIHHAAEEFGIYKSTLTRHVKAASIQELHTPKFQEKGIVIYLMTLLLWKSKRHGPMMID